LEPIASMSADFPEDLRERTFRFTCKRFDFCEDLARTPGPRRTIANQLFDAGSSIGANLAESKAAYTRKELAAKNAISLKESHESKYWLRVAGPGRWAERIFEAGCCRSRMNSRRC
jgi:four helix bundle protein